jgi:hypothetical protein
MVRELQVKQYVAMVRNSWGLRLTVFETADPKFYLFIPMVGETSAMGDLQIPVRKADLRDDIRRALTHGVGNSL